MMMTQIQLQWEETACDWCGSTESELFFIGPDRGERLPGEFRLVCCKNCSLIRQNPRPSWQSLSQYYPEDYHAFFSLVKDDPQPLRRLNKRYAQRKLRKTMERYLDSGRLLEVGCGTGLFLEEMSRSGDWRLVGIEPDRKAANYVEKHLGFTVYQDRLSEVALEAKSFDAVVLWNVLEHLGFPIQDLKKIHHILKDGSWLVFSIPNLEGLGARVFHQYWIGWDLPRHLYLYPKDNIYQILDKLGFDIIESKCISNSYATLGLSLEFWSQSWEDRFPAFKRKFIKLYNSRLIRGILVLPLSILDWLKLTTIVTIIAQKRS
ncbi:class I SAM-dependent methyltransferase [Chloroflexota bacterium]